MPTIKEMNARMDALNKEWLTNFKPLYRAGNNLKRVMYKRIFGTGNKGGYNTAMDSLPTFPYSTTPIYVDPNSVRNAPASFKFGKSTTTSKNGKPKKGKPIKSLYFPEGYAQLKTKTSATLPLQLTGNLKGGFFQSEVIKDGLSVSVTLPDSEVDKADGLQFGNRNFKGYGVIFQPTDMEEEEFLLLHGQYVVDVINELLK
jgi:hypothetical protein